MTRSRRATLKRYSDPGLCQPVPPRQAGHPTDAVTQAPNHPVLPKSITLRIQRPRPPISSSLPRASPYGYSDPGPQSARPSQEHHPTDTATQAPNQLVPPKSITLRIQQPRPPTIPSFPRASPYGYSDPGPQSARPSQEHHPTDTATQAPNHPVLPKSITLRIQRPRPPISSSLPRASPYGYSDPGPQPSRPSQEHHPTDTATQAPNHPVLPKSITLRIQRPRPPTIPSFPRASPYGYSDPGPQPSRPSQKHHPTDTATQAPNQPVLSKNVTLGIQRPRPPTIPSLPRTLPYGYSDPGPQPSRPSQEHHPTDTATQAPNQPVPPKNVTLRIQRPRPPTIPSLPRASPYGYSDPGPQSARPSQEHHPTDTATQTPTIPSLPRASPYGYSDPGPQPARPFQERYPTDTATQTPSIPSKSVTLRIQQPRPQPAHPSQERYPTDTATQTPSIPSLPRALPYGYSDPDPLHPIPPKSVTLRIQRPRPPPSHPSQERYPTDTATQALARHQAKAAIGGETSSPVAKREREQGQWRVIEKIRELPAFLPYPVAHLKSSVKSQGLQVCAVARASGSACQGRT
ncbi:extensin-like [Rhinatrema bivittatum]|uniref:extensin-like n=1 Tax=Rhinatrema bivittatum TaxID=194408 RepID=UPI00112948F5|nr:extensin-like [Rhinatrema bivittatum]